MKEKGVRNFVDSMAKFDLADPFGLGRIRQLAYELKMQEMNLNWEIDRLRGINEDQSRAVMLIVHKLNLDTDTSSGILNRMETELCKQAETIEALKAYAEDLEAKLKQSNQANRTLRFQYDSAVALIRKLKPETPVEEIEVRDAASV